VKPLPIACNLDAEQGPARIAQWRSVGERAQLGAELTARTLVVTYRESALDELAALVQAERSCCAFLDWSLERSAGRATLKVQADEAGEPELSRLAALFGASG
jgi:hypothetical protein